MLFLAICIDFINILIQACIFIQEDIETNLKIKYFLRIHTKNIWSKSQKVILNITLIDILVF